MISISHSNSFVLYDFFWATPFVVFFFFLCVYVFLRLWSFFNLKDRTKWCLVVIKKLQLFFFWLILKNKNSILFFKNPTLEKGIFFFSIKSSSNCQVLEKRNEKEFDFITERHLEFRWKNKPLDIAEIFVSKVIARQWSGGTTKMYPKHLCGWLTTADQNVHSIRHIVVVICEWVCCLKNIQVMW